jgi:hypothetical protein
MDAPAAPAKMAAMRPAPLALLLLAAPLLAAAVPALKALEGHAAGSWSMTPIGGGDAETRCLADAGPMLTGGRPSAACSFSVLDDGDSAATVNFRCEGSVSGRTVIRRDTGGLYTVRTQGVASGLPFVARSEWRYKGSC